MHCVFIAVGPGRDCNYIMHARMGTAALPRGGHVHPTFVRGRSWDWCKSGEFLLAGEGGGRSSFGAWLALRFRTLSSKWPSWNLPTGALPLWPLIRGLCSWTPLGALPPDPVIASRSARSPCVSTPHFLPGDAPDWGWDEDVVRTKWTVCERGGRVKSELQTS